jgi:regulator of sigma E protease
MIITILIFIIILGLLVFVHEAGHFFAAKQAGMKVDEFGFGFPPRLVGLYKIEGKWRLVFGKKSLGETQSQTTVYSINAIPLGGFVKIVGENNEDIDNPQSFVNKPFGARLRTLVAGVLMNVILAWLLLSVGYIYGLPVAVDDPNSLGKNARLDQQQVVIIDVGENSPAAQAGITPGDIILSINGQQFPSILATQDYVNAHKGETLEVTVKRINETKHLNIASQANPPAGSGPTGVALAVYGRLHFPWYTALWQGAQTTYYQVYAIVGGLYHLIFQGEGLKNLGGPVKIAQLTGQVAQLGLVPLMQFTAFLSLNLAILNILPFPALDGGRVLFLLIEKLRRKRNNQRVEQIFNTVGFLMLLLLMAVITGRDILNTSVIQKIIG